MKKLLTAILATCLTLVMSTSVFAAAQTPMVWAYDSANDYYVPSITATIVNHVPASTIAAFNAHGGQVVIDGTKADQMGKAGYTNGIPTSSGWYTWDSPRTYVTITPSYGLGVMNRTVLHEFGHVLDMQTGATNNSDVIATISSELPAYAALEANTGYMIPATSDAQELFAQIFACVVSNNDGSVGYSAESIAACPKTAAYVKQVIASLK